MVLQHEPEYMSVKHRCQRKGCTFKTFWRCPGCAKADDPDCLSASCGYYCHNPTRNCIAANHRKRARTKATGEGEESEEDE